MKIISTILLSYSLAYSSSFINYEEATTPEVTKQETKIKEKRHMSSS